MEDPTPICPYCGKHSVRSTGAELYAHRPDLADKQFFRCVPCEAWVGVHAMSGAPMGGLANSKLRKLRSAVHAAFDPIWSTAAFNKWSAQFGKAKEERKSQGYFIPRYRTKAYEQLAKAMDISPGLCHIAMFNEEQCQKALDILNAGGVTLR